MKPRVIAVRPLPQATFFLDDQQYPTFDVLFSGDFRDVLSGSGELTVQIRAVDDSGATNQHKESSLVLGTVKGTLTNIPNRFGHYYLNVSGPANVAGALSGLNATPDARRRLGFETPQVAFAFDYKATSTARLISFALPADIRSHSIHGDSAYAEGDSWSIEVYVPELDIASPPFPVAWNRAVIPSRFSKSPTATYDWHAGNSVKFFIDASKNPNGTEGAFHEISAAIDAAETFVFIVDWSFHPTMRLNPKDHTLEGTIAAKLLRKAEAGVTVAVLTWFHSKPVAELANESAWDIIKVIAGKVGSKKSPSDNLMWRANTRSSISSGNAFFSHHQKFIVTDVPGNPSEIQVFYGGLDLTKGRFDSPSHGISASDGDVKNLARRLTEMTHRTFSREQYEADFGFDHEQDKKIVTDYFDDWYNAEFNGGEMPDDEGPWVRQPWHDIHARLRGPLAWDFAREFVMRWSNTGFAPKESNFFSSTAVKKVSEVFFEKLMNRALFRQQWDKPIDPGPWSGQLLHSFHSKHAPDPAVNAKWHPGRKEFVWRIHNSEGEVSDFERSIQDAYVRAISNADRFIHIENQYFIGSGAKWPTPQKSVHNSIPEAIVNRIRLKAGGKHNFHVYIVLPMMPEGKPVLQGTDTWKDGMQGVRNLEWRTISWMIKSLREAGLKDWNKYLSFYFHARGDGVLSLAGPKDVKGSIDEKRMRLTKRNRRYMIYVHSKLMIVDDRFVILGSANINERSMAGDRDTEICLSLWPSTNREGHAPTCRKQIVEELRTPLLNEYFRSSGSANSSQPAPSDNVIEELLRLATPLRTEQPVSVPAGDPESDDYRNLFQQNARNNYLDLFHGRKPAGHLAMFPFDVADDGKTLINASWIGDRGGPDTELHKILIDGLWTPADPDCYLDSNNPAWSWAPELPTLFKKSASAGSLLE